MTELLPAIAQAQQLFKSGYLDQAERVLINALEAAPRDVELLNAVASLYLATNRLAHGAVALARVIEVTPDAAEAYHALATVLNDLGRGNELVGLYQRLIDNCPSDALAHFNLACCLRREGQLERAIDHHRRAIALGVERPEEVWTNIGVLQGELHRHADARASFDAALALNADWIPALYNLALWHEEHGERPAAAERFEHILRIDPNYYEATARLAHLRRCESRDDPLIARMSQALVGATLPTQSRESLHFALGKALDDCGSYDEAFAHFSAANESARARGPRYDREATATLFDGIRSAFTQQWLQACKPVSDRPLLFICGMFRSGSTLLEQMLAANPAIQSGGEIGWFRGTILWEDPQWPGKLVRASDEVLRGLGEGYLAYLSKTFPGDSIVADKRPDNFLLLGLLHGMFPNARFLQTVRDPRDTGLSIYFQQFDDALGYPSDIGDIAHYQAKYLELMRYWRAMLGSRLLSVRYEKLVDDARSELMRVCEFLGIDFHEDMLAFHEGGGRVRTASVWQVRQPLYKASIGRWRHYAAHLGALTELVVEDEP